MNAFPSELLHHHFACMVVAGLTPPSNPSAPSTTAAAAASPSTSSSAAPQTPSSTDAAPDSTASATGAPPDLPTSLFPDLTKSLHDILSSRARNTLWDPSRGRSAVFHTVFADHSVRLPPLKTKPSSRHVAPIASITTGSPSTPSESSTAAFSALPPRSPLSPLHPNSPQFPDGLIAPVWVRKHRELIPSVFVSFHCLPTSSDSEELRQSDEALIKTVSDRRRTLAERGIKLTIVLLTQREMLDNTQLEARLSFIRRNSGLDSKASLFVLTPVTKQELGEFVTSLHSALFEPAADYYREHARRVKRKRTRYPPPPSTLQPIVNALGTLPPVKEGRAVSLGDVSWLSREGWIVRSEYKLGVFAELAGDMPEALSRYRDAYDLLCNSPTCLLGSTLMLPPRTKRWAEAKVLADTLSVRICKLLLYADDGEGAAVFFRKHLARFTELSTGWGIGAMTFEYWSWLSKQYRLFGELVEQATRAIPGSPLPPFQLAVHAPPLPSRLLHPDALPRFSDSRGEVIPPPNMLLPNSAAVLVSTIPGITLQPPGAYFYLAALCTLERRLRFLRASGDDDDSSPLAHERKVDHTAQLTEALTKAYDAFKRDRQHRSALMVAARIATAYHEGGQDEMALKFLERVGRSYAKEGWGEVRKGLVETAVSATVRVGERRGVVRGMVEVLDPEVEGEGKGEVVEAVKRFLVQSKDDAEEDGQKGPVEVTAAFLDVDVVFAMGEVDFGSEVPFQVVVRNRASVDLTDVLTAERLTLHFQSGDETHQTSVEIPAGASTETTSLSTLIVDLGPIDLESTTHTAPTADLQRIFNPANGPLVLQGSIKAHLSGAVRISRATVHVSAGAHVKLDLDLPLNSADSFTTALQPCTWLVVTRSRMRTLCIDHRASPSTTLVRPPHHHLSLSLTPPSTSLYIDERIPLTVTLHNHESTPLEVVVDAVLQPSYDGARDTLDEGEGGGQQVSIPMAVEGGTVGERKIWLTGRGKEGLRVVDVGVRVGDEVVERKSLAVLVEKLFEGNAWVDDAVREEKDVGLLDFDNDTELEEGEREVGLDIEMLGQRVDVSSVQLVSGETVVSSSSDAMGEWILRDRFSFSFPLPFPKPSSPLSFKITWSHPDSTPQSTLIPLQPSPSPTAQPSLTVTLTYPTNHPVLHPLPIHLTLTNTHSSTSLPVTLTLESDDHFTQSSTRRLTIPYLLPGQKRVCRDWARIVPQGVGVWRLPGVGVRVGGEGEGTSSVEWEQGRRGEAVVFRYVDENGGWRESLPRIRVTL